ncbi:MAG TPA: NADH-quinone oxidoreductase subunit NuoG [Fimbriimonadaceae bacterium]|nr:NADH-quinone oxidoreductase subunit NuoG [Fimbriimonadaceae bacterium]
MAAVASEVELVNISINGVALQVPKGELIVESVKRLGLEIPIFCYHPRMKPVGMCRMCLVEVGFPGPDGNIRKMPKPQAGCTLPASEGMAIFTDTEQIHRDRKGVLEFLLVNHPLDCPICDRGGECPLQNNTLFYGPSTSRFLELKRHLPKAFPLSKYVTLDLERCIQCGRCVRFTEEISGDSQLAFRFRGASMQPSTFELTDFESKFSGNVIEICPVGALTNREYRFRARPWDLETKPAICTVCSNGCNIWFDHRAGRMVRTNGRTNEAINEEWTCDRGKFGHEFYNDSNRVKHVMVRNGDALVESDWPTAYDAIRMAFAEGGNRVAALTGPSNSNEDLYLLKKLFQTRFNSNNFDSRWTTYLPTAEDDLQKKMGVSMVQNTIADFESMSKVFIFGSSLADELPILFLRVRKGWFNNGNKVVVASDKPTDADSFAAEVLRYRTGTESTLASGLLALAVEKGLAQVPDATRQSLSKYTAEHVSDETGVSVDALHRAVELVAGAGIITSHGIFNTSQPQDTVETLAGLAMTTNGSFNCYALGANDQGALDMGVVPFGGGMDTHSILQGCIDGTVKALWLVGGDPFELHPDYDLVEKALENVHFLVVMADHQNGAVPFASVLLPETAPAEQDGTFTNMERRVQRMPQVLAAKGSAKPAWRVFSELAIRIQPETPPFGPADCMKEIAESIPSYAVADYANLGGEGVLIR